MITLIFIVFDCKLLLPLSYLRSSKPYTEVIFLYFQKGNLTVENYANRTVTLSGFSACSSICNIIPTQKSNYPVNLIDVVNLTMNGQSFYYNLSKGSKSYIVLMRNVSREVYVDVKE